MSTIENVVTTVEPTSHTASAQARLRDLRLMRDLIPRFSVPTSAKETVRLSSAASVPPDFVELTAVAITNEDALVRGGSLTAAEIRELMSYGDAYSPVADELEALAQFIRHSVAVARNQAGSEALTTYSLTLRLAKRPHTSHLAPYAADMRRALGRTRKTSPEAPARKVPKTTL